MISKPLTLKELFLMLIVYIDYVKFQGKSFRDITVQIYEKCKKDCIVFKGTDSINGILDYVLQFKGEAKKLITKLSILIYTYLLTKDQDLIVMLY